MRSKPKLSYANVMSTLAMFVVLGGGVAWAHGKIGTSDLRNKAVTTPKLANRAVAPNKIRQKAVRPAKLGDDAVRSRALGNIVERTNPIMVVDGSQNNGTADCQPGEAVVSGGAEWDNLSTGVRLQQSHRDGSGWNAGGANDSGATRTLTVKVYCLQ